MRNIKRKNENSLINHFIQIIKKEIIKKRKRNKRLSFVLTGGSSPKRLYKKLSQSNIEWSYVDLFWGDERFVSKRSKNSNYKLVKDLLLDKINISEKNYFPIQTNKNSVAKSALSYESTIKKYFKSKKVKFDIFLLGMRNDGHIASIFPDSKELKEKFITKPVMRKDFKRITLGLNIINNSEKIFLWLNSKTKISSFRKFKNKGIKIPVNNLKKNRLYCFYIN